MKTLIAVIEVNFDEVVITKNGDRQYLCESIAETIWKLGIRNSPFSYYKKVKADGSQDLKAINPVCSTKRGILKGFNEGDHFKQHGTCTIEIYENSGISQSLFGYYSFRLARISIPQQ